jgi:hypothetical protein
MLKNYKNKVKELITKNQELESQIKTKLGLSETEVLPADWEKEFIKKSEVAETDELVAKKYEEDLKEAREAIRLAEAAKTETESKYVQEKLVKEQILQEKTELEAKLKLINTTGKKAEITPDVVEELSESAGSEREEIQLALPEITIDDYESEKEEPAVKSIESEQWQENLLGKQKKLTDLESEKKQLEQAVKDLQKKGVDENELTASQAKLQAKKKELEELRNQFEQEKMAWERLMLKKEVETQQQIQQLQAEKNRLAGEKKILEELLAERKAECQEIINQLTEKEQELLEAKGGQEELEVLRAEKTRLEGELRGAEKNQTRLEKKLGETEQEMQTNQKTEDLLLQEQSQESDLLLMVSSTEVKEKNLKERYPGLAKILNETKNKLKPDDYKWLIKVFEAQEELINLENQVNPKPKTKEISEAKWKLRSFQSKLKKEKLGEVLIRSKELIEKQVKSQPTSSSMKRSSSASPMRRQLSNPQRAQIQQSELPPFFKG